LPPDDHGSHDFFSDSGPGFSDLPKLNHEFDGASSGVASSGVASAGIASGSDILYTIQYILYNENSLFTTV